MTTPTPPTTPPLLPVTLISGFLGAGKSTLLRNILEAKHHSNQKFRCAVLVNDMAELNIDQALIETTGLVESDEVISMQNGCVCCNLAGDMIDQIIKLTQQTDTPPFDYLIIEASGVSEPAAICSLFHTETHNHDHHDHDHDHDDSSGTRTSLGDVAKMDTIVTVVDASDFLENLEKMEDPNRKDYPRLLVEQVEYSNVVLLNKTDLVSPRQLQDVKDKVVLLTNGFGKIMECENAQVEVDAVVQTGLYDAHDFDLSKFVTEHFAVENDGDKKPPKSCCSTAKKNGESPCCRRARTIDSGKSQILLPSKQLSKTRHGEQDKITSFVYTSRRPFVPSALYDNFVDRFFLSEDTVEDEDDDPDNDDHDAPLPEKKKAKVDEEEEASAQARLAAAIHKMQEDGARKKKDRIDALGQLLRLKGYLWQGNSHDLIGYISTAGNLSRIESPGRWNCLQPQSYQGTPDEQAANRKKHHWEGVYGDRRQELVFIGQDLNHLKIQELLDGCLLSDAQMAMGPDAWKATFGDVILDDQ